MKKSKTILALIIIMNVLISNFLDIEAISFSGGFSPRIVTNLYYYRATNESYLSNAANNWNNISSKVHSSSNSNYYSHVYITESTSGSSGVLGRIVAYKSSCTWPLDPSERISCFTVANTTETWNYVYLYVYVNNATTSTSQKYTAVHEYGHVLSQAHNNDYSVMRQGIYSLTAPTNYDKNSLRSRWGN